MDLSIERRLRELENTLERLRKSDLPLYVEGTYTPTMTGETSAGVTTYVTQVGSYIRVGDVIVVVGNVEWTAATGTGNMIISLPFTAQNTSGLFPSVSLWTQNLTFASGAPQALVIANTSYFRLYYPASNAATTTIPVEAAAQVAFQATYFV